MKLSQIDFSKIRIPLVVSLIQNQISNGITDFSDLQSTAPNQSEISTFNKVDDTYYLNHPIKKTFNHYLSANPSQAWKGGSLVSFGLGLDKNSGAVFYPGEEYPGAKEGQVMYIYLSFWGLKKICMAQEIIKIDPVKNTIVFSYVQGGMTNGMQVMQFSTMGENKTKIVHTSYFKGVSRFRDQFLYPYFHSKVVSRFHENLLASI